MKSTERHFVQNTERTYHCTVTIETKANLSQECLAVVSTTFCLLAPKDFYVCLAMSVPDK
jgi:hypothetical protein